MFSYLGILYFSLVVKYSMYKCSLLIVILSRGIFPKL